MTLQANQSAAGVMVGVFGKHWTPGRTKTRLAATLGDERAARASKLFLRTTLSRLGGITAQRLLAFAPADKEHAFVDLTHSLESSWEVAPQPPGSLGDRMRWFFDHAAEHGARSAVLLGSDSPDFPLDAVRSAIDWLEAPEREKGVVFGPAVDGGYWLIGSRGPTPPVLGEMPWSHEDLLKKTIERLESHGWRRGAEYELTAEWCDIDTGADLESLKRRLDDTAPADSALARLATELQRS